MDLQHKIHCGMRRWDLYREEREKAVDIYIKKLKHVRLIKNLNTYVLMRQFMKKAWDGYAKLKHERRVRHDAMTLCWLYFYNYRAIHCRRHYGLDYNFRMKNYIRRIFSFVAGSIMSGRADPRGFAVANAAPVKESTGEKPKVSLLGIKV